MNDGVVKIPASRWTSAGLALAGTAALALVVPALGDPPAFSGPAIYPFAFAPTRDVAPDLNNDGRPDLAVANASAETKGAVGIYLSRADGVLQRQPDTALAHFESFGLAAADLNKDGNVDLAVTKDRGRPARTP